MDQRELAEVCRLKAIQGRPQGIRAPWPILNWNGLLRSLLAKHIHRKRQCADGTGEVVFRHHVLQQALRRKDSGEQHQGLSLEQSGRSSAPRAVELLAVREGARVMHLHIVWA